MRALRSQSDRCVHNIDDQMNLQFQGSLSGSNGKMLGYDVRSPGFKFRLGTATLLKITKSLFISKEIGDGCISLSPHE